MERLVNQNTIGRLDWLDLLTEQKWLPGTVPKHCYILYTCMCQYTDTTGVVVTSLGNTSNQSIIGY